MAKRMRANRLWAIVAIFLLALILVPVHGAFAQAYIQKVHIAGLHGAPAKSYGAGQVLSAFDVVFDECWIRPLHDESWYKCDEWNKSTNRQALAAKDIKYVWPRTISYTPFTLPLEGNMFLEVSLELDATHTGWLQYDVQRYDEASGKWA